MNHLPQSRTTRLLGYQDDARLLIINADDFGRSHASEVVLAAGLSPTHLNWHCLYNGGRADTFEMTVNLAQEYGLAVRVFDRSTGEALQH